MDRLKVLWLIIVICNTIDLLYSYALWIGYIGIPGGAIELNFIVRLIENNGVFVLPDLISLKIIGLVVMYWVIKFLPSRLKMPTLKAVALIFLGVVIYELFILPLLS
ncbi:hypothetical protein [Saccharolobus shibatae]|uniref:DUF5658 domain-containing protein n=1 Tax=Saccharolobus shibatae TaxID=2286 RepID=A0A8F5C1A1_9CREN|nr:hypothetical protein [Saccharolobus shibatae]QXJ32081.1 hypothetical protein J5U21_01732 [Saccharolobus shibatae]QXJ35063.1 hypothetical protein J5U22_01610 [Saccharolobus shibatae]